MIIPNAHIDKCFNLCVLQQYTNGISEIVMFFLGLVVPPLIVAPAWPPHLKNVWRRHWKTGLKGRSEWA